MKIELCVSEPWDFDVGDGSNFIIADVDDLLSGTRRLENGRFEDWFVCHCDPIQFKHIYFRSLLITPRHAITLHPLRVIKSRGIMHVNCAWRKDEGVWDKESVHQAHEGTLEVGGFVIATAQAVFDT